MTTERDPQTRLVLSWLREDLHENADRVLATALDEVDATPQRRSWWPARRFADMSNPMRYVAAAALVAAVVIGGIAALPRDLAVGPSPSPKPMASQTGLLPTNEASASTLPVLDLPGSRAAPAGEYGWTGGLGSKGGMHSVVSAGTGSRMTQLVFAVMKVCFPRATADEPVPVTVAGLDGMYAEPYVDPSVLFMPEPDPGQTTGAYALPIGDRTLCVYLTWDATTTRAELDAARQVVESIRGEPFGTDGIRIIFTLPPGWDTG